MLEPTQQWSKLFPSHAYQRQFLHLTHQDAEQGLDCSLCCKLLFWLQSLWADVIVLLRAHSTSHHRTPVRGPEVLSQNKMAHQSCHLSGPTYLFLYFSSVCSWYVFQNQTENFAVSCRSFKEMSFILVVCDSGPKISDLTYCYHDIWKKLFLKVCRVWQLPCQRFVHIIIELPGA